MDSLTTTVDGMTTLEIKNITSHGNNLVNTYNSSGTLETYLLKVLFSVNNCIEYCHIRVNYDKLRIPAYKIDRCIFNMRASDELGYLEGNSA